LAFDIQIVIDLNERLAGHGLNSAIAAFGAGAAYHKSYLFFFIQSSMHVAQKRSPHPVHSLGLRTTLVQMGQSNMSPVRLGKRYLS